MQFFCASHSLRWLIPRGREDRIKAYSPSSTLQSSLLSLDLRRLTPVLLRVVAASLADCNFAWSEGLSRWSVALLIASIVVDAKTSHIVAGVARLGCCVCAGSVWIVSERLYGRTRLRRRMRTLCVWVRRVSAAILGHTRHSITMSWRADGVLLRRKRLSTLGSAVNCVRLTVGGRRRIGIAVWRAAAWSAHRAEARRRGLLLDWRLVRRLHHALSLIHI